MQSCFLTVLGEVIRMTLTNSTPYKILSITLTPVPNQGNRARAAARFTVSVALSWGPLPWAAGVLLVDQRGYPLQWQLDAVGKWLVKALSGADCVVNMTITNGAHIPARWSLARITAAAAKVSGVEAQNVIDDAAAKVASVALWAASDRKTAVIDAARRMNEAAELLLVAQSVQRGGSLVPDPVPDPVPVVPVPVGFVYVGAVVANGLDTGGAVDEVVPGVAGVAYTVDLVDGEAYRVNCVFGEPPAFDLAVYGVFDMENPIVIGGWGNEFQKTTLDFVAGYTGAFVVCIVRVIGSGSFSLNVAKTVAI